MVLRDTSSFVFVVLYTEHLTNVLDTEHCLALFVYNCSNLKSSELVDVGKSVHLV